MNIFVRIRRSNQVRMKIPEFNFRLTNFLLAVLLFGCLFLTATLLDFNGLYGQDAHEYLRLTRALSIFFYDGTAISHSYFPILYPLAAFLISKIVWNDIAAMQLVSIIALVASFFYLKKLLQLIHSQATLLNGYLVAFFFLSPYVFRFGLLAMSDMLCSFFVLAAVYHALSYSKLPAVKHSVLCGLFAAFAISTRYAVILLVLFPSFILLRAILINKDFKAIVFTLFAFCCVLIPDLLIRDRILFLDTGSESFSIDYAANAYAWSPVNFFRNTFQNPDGNQHYDFWNIVAVTFNIIHPAYLFIGAVLIFFLKRNDFAPPSMKLLLIMVIVYGFFIAGLNYQNNRYLLQSFPFLLVIFYPAFSRMVKRYFFKPGMQQVFYAMIILSQLVLFWYSFQKIRLLNDTEREIASSLKPYAGQTVYTCSIVGALSSYEVNNPVVDLYFTPITHPAPNSLVIFNYPEFSRYYAGRTPMYNWNVLNDQAPLRIVRSFPNGWALYTVEQQPAVP
ncbi:MAG: hypothetical protein ABIO46_11685 [Chitinophagales bacterium]